MQFSPMNLVAILLAIPAVAAQCELRVQWVTNWREGGYRRYQVTLITTPRNDNHLGTYCNYYRIRQPEAGANVQCFWDFDGRYKVDGNYVEGSSGHNDYLHDHSSAAADFANGSGCQVITDL